MRGRLHWFVLFAAAWLASLSQSVAAADARVLVLANAKHPWSVRLAKTYLATRGLSEEQLLTVEVASDAVVPRAVYQQSIERPVVERLLRTETLDRTVFVVLAPGFPLRIAGSPGRNGSGASVDSELALLYRRLTGAVTPLAGGVSNPYFHPGSAADAAFDRAKYDIYLVTRLDGRTEQDVRSLVQRGGSAIVTPVVVVDGRPPEASGLEARWLAEVGPRVQGARADARIVQDTSAEIVRGVSGVNGYAAWGSNDAPFRGPPVAFGPGAIGTSFMSSDARTMASPPAGWSPGPWDDVTKYFAGSPEALAADWLAAGLTGLGSQVAEPYLDGAFRPGTLLEAWVRGYTLAEAYYLALPYLSWQSVVFGDPLARGTDSPVKAVAPPTASGPEGFFVARAAAVLRDRQPTLNESASLLMARANLSIARGQIEEARTLLEQVTVAAPRYAAAHLALGIAHDAAQRHDLAKARYEAVLALEPANVTALNNLAFVVGVHEGRPKEALPLAERAGELGSNSPAVLDTLGWIRHLAGDSRRGLDPLRRAVQADDGLCEAWAHLAIVERAVGNDAAANKADERARGCAPAAQ